MASPTPGGSPSTAACAMCSRWTFRQGLDPRRVVDHGGDEDLAPAPQLVGELVGLSSGSGR